MAEDGKMEESNETNNREESTSVTSADLDFFRQMERDLGLPDDFVMLLLLEKDDWSFVVKLHALCETIITQTVVRLIAQPQIEDTVSRMLMHVKVRLVRDFSAISDDHELSDLRSATSSYCHSLQAAFGSEAQFTAWQRFTWLREAPTPTHLSASRPQDTTYRG